MVYIENSTFPAQTFVKHLRLDIFEAGLGCKNKRDNLGIHF